jgi:two-component system sensor histidine kinase AlgZ
MPALTPVLNNSYQDTGMSKQQNKEHRETTVSADYSRAVTTLLLFAALLSTLLIIAGRGDSWDQGTLTDFITLLSVSCLVAVTDALVLKLFNPLLKPLPLRTSLVSAYTLLMVTTFIIYYGLYSIFQQYWSPTAPIDWAQPSFLQLYIIATVNYLVVLAIISYMAKNTAIKEASQTAKLQALQSRIRPHFMFNSMNSIASLIRNNPSMAEQALQDLADLIRVLMADVRKLVPLTAEIETSKQYLNIEKLRLGDRLSVQWHVQGIPKNCFVPSLVLQPLLENAVYHGIEPSFGGGVIDIDMRADNERVQILIRNPLPDDGERNHRKGNQIAMDNIQQRLARHFGEASSLSSSRRNEIHITKIIFPIITNRQTR